jgi:hypothetical protein
MLTPAIAATCSTSVPWEPDACSGKGATRSQRNPAGCSSNEWMQNLAVNHDVSDASIFRALQFLQPVPLGEFGKFNAGLHFVFASITFVHSPL